MSVLPYRKRTVQPSHPVAVDRSNSLTDKLTALFYPIGGQFVDVANNKFPTTDTSTQRVGKLGRYREYSNQDTRFANIPAYHLTGACTLILVLDVDALTNYGALISCQDSATTNGYELRLGNGSSGSEIVMIRANTSWNNSFVTAGNQITAGTKDNFIALTFANGLIETDPTFYNINGTKHTAFTTTSPSTGAAVASTDDFRVGRRYDTVTKLDGAINFIAMFDREMSFAETEQIRANPYNLLQPRTQFLDITVEAAPSSFEPGWAMGVNTLIGGF